MDFKKIPGFDDYYVNRNGDVLSKKGLKDRILKPADNNTGYNIVNLCKNKKQKTYLVHRLVALTFIPNPNNYEMIDHIDRNKKNNYLDNLRWCSRQMNEVNKSKHKNNTSGFKHIRFSKTHKKYQVRISRNGKSITQEFFDTIEEAVLYRNAVLDDLGESFDNID